MNTKDLNLEDLVLYTDKEGEIETPCKINSLNLNGEWSAQILNSKFIFQGDNNECSVEECLLPIPLTPEILEKNGFEKYPYKNSYWYCGEMLELFVKIVCIFPIEDRKLRSSLPAPVPRLSAGEDDVYIRCDYVHELQHALEFCGIDKEIVL